MQLNRRSKFLKI